MEARAIRKHIRSSPRKLRTVINVVRGERVTDALNALNFLPQKVTRDVKLTILSAVHNMMDQHSEERIDEGEHGQKNASDQKACRIHATQSKGE